MTPKETMHRLLETAGHDPSKHQMDSWSTRHKPKKWLPGKSDSGKLILFSIGDNTVLHASSDNSGPLLLFFMLLFDGVSPKWCTGSLGSPNPGSFSMVQHECLKIRCHSDMVPMSSSITPRDAQRPPGLQLKMTGIMWSRTEPASATCKAAIFRIKQRTTTTDSWGYWFAGNAGTKHHLLNGLTQQKLLSAHRGG